MSLGVHVKIKGDTATPRLAELVRTLEDRTDLNKRIADRAEELTAKHLMSLNRHATANRLGATPTSYYERKAQGLESRSDKNSAIVTIPTGDNLSGNPGMEAFARVLGPVHIVAQRSQWLTIPAIAAAYGGRRAREFEGLIFIKTGDAKAMLARRDGKKLTPFFWLRKEVTLSQDDTLLPKETEYAAAAEQGAKDYVRDIFAQV